MGGARPPRARRAEPARRRRCKALTVEGRPLEERELVLRAQRGDDLAFAELVRAHQEIAFRIAYLITGSTSDAEDAVQDGALKAWRALARFRVGEPWRPWLLSIVANEARNRRRSAGRRAQLALGRVASRPRGTRPRSPGLARPRRRRSLETSAVACSRRWRSCPRRRATCSPAATCWSCRRPRPRRHSACGGARSSRGRRGRSTG